LDFSLLFSRKPKRRSGPDPRRLVIGRNRRAEVIRLAEIWAWQAHATIEASDGSVGDIVNGEAANLASLSPVDALLSGAAVRIQVHRFPQASGRVTGMASRVWMAVLACWSSPAQVLNRPDQGISEGPAWGRLPELPVSKQTLSVLAIRRPSVTLSELISAAKAAPDRVARELSALSRLAIIELGADNDSIATPIERVQAPRPAASLYRPGCDPVRVDPVGAVWDRAALLRTLDDLRRLAPRRALGLGRDATMEAIAAARQELLVRYSPRLQDPGRTIALLDDIRAQVHRTTDLLMGPQYMGYRKRLAPADSAPAESAPADSAPAESAPAESVLVGPALDATVRGRQGTETEGFSGSLFH
jgi:hypothetical protein